jgi:hypothetical protein
MPDSTPIYGFTFPCPDETVSPAAFALLANQIDAALTLVNADAFLAANRFNVDLSASGFQVIAVNVETALTSVAATYTLPMSGVYIVHAVFTDDPGAGPTVTFFRGRVFQNGVFRFGFGQSTDNNTVHAMQPIGPIVGAAGDVITLRAFFNGAGTLGVNGRLDAKMIVRIA